MRFELIVYIAPNGKMPFQEWLISLKDTSVRNKIRLKVQKLTFGQFGNCKAIGDGIHKLKIDLGSGYRIYFANPKKIIILLLCGGNKSTQKKDIENAQKYFQDYQSDTL